jgi:putative DNA primase/helicase
MADVGMDDMPPDPGGEGGGDGGLTAGVDPGLLEAGAALPLNDSGNGQRLALYHGDRLRFVPRVGWHVWDGMRWRADEDDLGARCLCQTVQTLIAAEIPHLRLRNAEQQCLSALEAVNAEIKVVEASAAGGAGDDSARAERLAELNDKRGKLHDTLWGKGSTRARHLSFAKSSGNSGPIKNMGLESTTQLSVPVEALDSDPLLVNTQSGILRFVVEGGGDTGFSRSAHVELLPHARSLPGTAPAQLQILTKLMPVDYDPAATAPRFEAFLRRVQPDAEMRGFLQRWFGLSMTGLRIQKFAFLYGDGANGKSVIVDLIGRMLDGYAHSAKIESFTGDNRRRGGEATPDIFPLVWARMVRASEPDEGQKLQEGLIKELTGGEPILVRKLMHNFVEAHPFFKLVISGNHKPDIRGTDDGIWRRVLLVPFGEKIPPAERDEDLVDKLWQERSGILNWLCAGLLDYLEGGLQEPAQVLAATDDYRADSDPVGRFLSTACIITGDAGDRVATADLGRALNLWLALNGMSTWTPNSTGRKLNDRAGKARGPAGKTYERIKSGVTMLQGIRLTDEFQRLYDDAPRDRNGQPQPRQDGASPPPLPDEAYDL